MSLSSKGNTHYGELGGVHLNQRMLERVRCITVGCVGWFGDSFRKEHYALKQDVLINLV